MPMVNELPVCVLARARLGIVHSQVFGEFSGAALAGLSLEIRCRSSPRACLVTAPEAGIPSLE
ncbi:hypothetical protein [Streptomyces sp. NPDC050121]|uniref:hypothetical protein n=1 Tax=Streptomyces sp. NPDC050121 TaxID=3365601 RepID=UPI00379F2FB9